MNLYGSPRFSESYDVSYLLLYDCSVTTNRPSALLMIPYNMTAPSILKLIGILSKRSWNRDFFYTPYVSSADQRADIFTKGLHAPQFEELCDKLGVENIHSPASGGVLD